MRVRGQNCACEQAAGRKVAGNSLSGVIEQGAFTMSSASRVAQIFHQKSPRGSTPGSSPHGAALSDFGEKISHISPINSPDLERTLPESVHQDRPDHETQEPNKDYFRKMRETHKRQGKTKMLYPYYNSTITPASRSQYNSLAERSVKTIRRYFYAIQSLSWLQPRATGENILKSGIPRNKAQSTTTGCSTSKK